MIPLPGVTLTQSGLGVTLPDGRRAVFCGEAIHSPGRMARIAPLQYNYNDLSGAVQCALRPPSRLRQWRPDVLLPSLGEPICSEADAALALLQENLRQSGRGPAGHDRADGSRSSAEPLERVTDHVWLRPPFRREHLVPDQRFRQGAGASTTATTPRPAPGSGYATPGSAAARCCTAWRD